MLRLAFSFIVLLLAACSQLATQPPSIELHEVHPNGARRIAFSPDSTRLASGGVRGELLIWSVRSAANPVSLSPHKAGIRGLLWLDDDRLVSADKRGGIRLWDVPAVKVLASTRIDAVEDLAWSAAAGDVLFAVGGHTLYRLALPSLQVVASRGFADRLLSVAVNHAGDRVAVSTSGGEVSLLDRSLSSVLTLPRASRDALDLHFSPDDRTLLAGGWFRLLVWDLGQGTLEERPTEHRGLVVSVDISPDGKQWISLGRQTDSAFRLVDADTGQVIRRMQAQALCGWQARFSPDGRYAASSAEDGTIHIYDLTEPYEPVVQYPDF